MWETCGRHLETSGSIWEPSGRHLGPIWKHLGGLWEASAESGRHPGGLGWPPGGIWQDLGRIWEAWAPKVTPRWSEGSEAQNIDTPLSYNPLFHQKVLKSIEFLQKYRFCIDFYSKSVAALGRPLARTVPRPSIKTARTPTAEDCLGKKVLSYPGYSLLGLPQAYVCVRIPKA